MRLNMSDGIRRADDNARKYKQPCYLWLLGGTLVIQTGPEPKSPGDGATLVHEALPQVGTDQHHTVGEGE